MQDKVNRRADRKVEMKRFIRFSQIVFTLAGLILILGERHWFPDYYKPDLMGAISFAYAFLIHSPVLVWRTEDARKIKYRLRLQLALALGLLLSGLGSLGLWGLYKIGFEYDKVVHFIFSFLLTFAGAQFLKEYYTLSWKRAIWWIILVMVPVSVVWELVELFSARVLELGFYGHWWDRDSIIDIILDLAGMGAGILSVLWKKNENTG